MKKIFFIATLFVCQLALSQVNDPVEVITYNRYSLEVGLGYHLPMGPKSNGISNGQLSGVKQFSLAGRYMITDVYGVKAEYAFDRFEDRKDRGMGNSFNTFGVEGVANIFRAFDRPKYFIENYALLAHAGFGLTVAYPESRTGESGGFSPLTRTNRSDRMFNIMFGVTPAVKINENLAFNVDISYILNTAQQYEYNGDPVGPNSKKVTGSYMNFGVGLIFYFGKNTSAADWY